VSIRVFLLDNIRMKVLALLLCLLCFSASIANAQTVWQTNLDGKVRFYQTTDFGVMLAEPTIRFTPLTGRRAKQSGENERKVWMKLR
jgi:hypothetical protein